MGTDGIAIIGAGLAGLAAARALTEAGAPVRVFDKGRGPGGRVSTRRIAVGDAEGAVDHGAPALHPAADGPDEAAFRALMAAADAAPEGDGDGWIGVPTMSAIGKALAAGLDLSLSTGIDGIDGPPWRLTSTDGAVHGPFAAVIVAAPAPQAARLTGLDLSAVRMDPQWTGILAFDAPLDAPDRIEGAGDVALALRMAPRPGRPGVEAWAVHMDPGWSRARLETDRPAMAPALLSALGAALGRALPEPLHIAAHRWRFARTAAPLGRPFAADPTGTLVAGGDWALGPDAGHAVASGQAMAKAVLRTLGAAG